MVTPYTTTVTLAESGIVVSDGLVMTAQVAALAVPDGHVEPTLVAATLFTVKSDGGVVGHVVLPVGSIKVMVPGVVAVEAASAPVEEVLKPIV